MNSSEYSVNKKKERRSFKKYRKCIKKIFLWGGLGVLSAFVFPYGTLFTFLKGLVSEYLAGSITFIAQWGLATLGGLGAIINTINAHQERKKIEDAQDMEDDIVDVLVNENDKLTKKVEDLEKQKEKVNTEAKSNTKTNADLEKSSRNIDYEEEKKYTR